MIITLLICGIAIVLVFVFGQLMTPQTPCWNNILLALAVICFLAFWALIYITSPITTPSPSP